MGPERALCQILGVWEIMQQKNHPAFADRLAPALGRVVCQQQRLSWDSVSEVSCLKGPGDIEEEPQQHLAHSPTRSPRFCPDLDAAASVETWLGHTLLHGGHSMDVAEL